MSEANTGTDESITRPKPWDPFQLMDRMDEEALRKELEGVASTDLVYVVREGGQEVVGLSKTGVDECCMALVSQGQVIREEDLQYEVIGEGEGREALFKVKAARYAVSPEGQDVRLDQVIGVKRQSLYYDAAPLDLDARVPSKKFRGKTYRELLATDEGRDYLGWMAENFNEPEIRDFVRKILNGEAVQGSERSRQLNPHWYEHGAMKAARNARFRLIPGNVRAQVMATARQSGLTRVVEAQPGAMARVAKSTEAPLPSNEPAIQVRAEPRSEPVGRPGPYSPTEKQVAFYQRLAASPVFTDEERKRALDWLATKATRQTIKDQIDWLKRQVETRKPGTQKESAA
ncbi:MAG TPA: hypothetical protein VD930_10875 [Gemmatimonadales bacterium]|nr:hypothetical protein [Gemmatimonadales bacterium]